MNDPEDREERQEAQPAGVGGGTGPSAEERTSDDAAGAPAGDRDLDELLDDPDAASG